MVLGLWVFGTVQCPGTVPGFWVSDIEKKTMVFLGFWDSPKSPGQSWNPWVFGRVPEAWDSTGTLGLLQKPENFTGL